MRLPAAVTERAVLTGLPAIPVGWSASQRRTAQILIDHAAGFAAACRAVGTHPRDAHRSADLLLAIGLGQDECDAFLRTLDAGLVTINDDGRFCCTKARACSPNLHLIGREADHVKLHNEVLIHLGAYGELVVDHGWREDQLVFDPFMAGDALDLWGYDSPPEPGNWRDGRVTVAAEAKSRIEGGDGLRALVAAFHRLEHDPSANVSKNSGRKWSEIDRLTSAHGTVALLLVANDARWWYEASQTYNGLALIRTR